VVEFEQPLDLGEGARLVEGGIDGEVVALGRFDGVRLVGLAGSSASSRHCSSTNLSKAASASAWSVMDISGPYFAELKGVVFMNEEFGFTGETPKHREAVEHE